VEQTKKEDFSNSIATARIIYSYIQLLAPNTSIQSRIYH